MKAFLQTVKPYRNYKMLVYVIFKLEGSWTYKVKPFVFETEFALFPKTRFLFLHVTNSKSENIFSSC